MMSVDKHSSRAPASAMTEAIVLCRAVTGLATVRALATRGVRVHALIFDAADPLNWSRHAVKVDVSEHACDQGRLLAYLEDYAVRLGGRPVVIATSDAHALMLAEHRERLQSSCRIASTDVATLRQIIGKEQLYRSAEQAGVATIPCLGDAPLADVNAWSARNPGPYFLKPSYEAVAQSSVQAKNLLLSTREQLLSFVGERGLRHAVVQRFLAGGDGEIYDSYGLCDHRGRIVAMASHRRVRQYPPDTGTTSFGAIPSGLPDDDLLFEPTRQLLAQWRYHGIFGIEWLRDRDTGRFYLIDFNARPFSSIGHLNDAGLNLPWLAWRELQGESLQELTSVPALEPSLWIDALRDVASWRRARRGPLWNWLCQWRRADHHAYWDRSDPGPACRLALSAVGVIAGVAWRALRRPAPARERVQTGFRDDRETSAPPQVAVSE